MFAAALLDLVGESTDGDYVPPLPDMRERDGWVWSSQPVEVRLLDGGSAIVARPPPAGGLPATARSPRAKTACASSSSRATQLEDELREAGHHAGRAPPIPPTEDHVGSIVVIGEVRDG